MKVLFNSLPLLFIYSCFFTPLVAQPTGDIVADKKLAEQYFEEAQKEDLVLEQKIELITKAIELYEAHPFDKQLITLKRELAFWYINKLKYDVALDIAKEIERLAEEATIEKSDAIWQHYYMIEQAVFAQKNYNKSIPAAQKALQLVTKPSLNYFLIIKNLILDYGYSGQLKQLITLLEEVETVLKNDEKARFQNQWKHYYRGKMLLYYYEQNFENSIIYGKKCVEEYEKQSENTSSLCVEIGNSYTGMGQFDEAIEWIEKGINRFSNGKENPDLGTYYANLAYVYHVKKDYQKSIELNQKAIALLLLEKEKYYSVLGTVYNYLSKSFTAINDLEQAEKYLKESFDYEASLSAYLDYATILATRFDFEEALNYIQQALIAASENFESTDIKENPSPYESYVNNFWGAMILHHKVTRFTNWGMHSGKADYFYLSNKTAYLSIVLAEKLHENMNGYDQSKFMMNRMIAYNLIALIENYNHLYQLNNDLEDRAALFENMEKQKAMMLLKTLTPSSLPQEIVIEEQQLVNHIRKYNQKIALTSADSLDFYENKLFQTSQKLEDFQTKLLENYPKEANNFYNIQYVNPDDIQNTLDENTLLISYTDVSYLAKKHPLIAYTISKEEQQVFNLATGQEFKETIKQIQKLSKSVLLEQEKNSENFISLSYQLYETLLKPLESMMEGKTKLIIIPDGQLFHLPFEVLLASNEKKPLNELDYLIKKFNINYHYSATLYQQLKEKPAISDNSFLGFAPVFRKEQLLEATDRGSYDFITDSLYRSIEDKDFIALPNSKKEVKTIAKILESKQGKTNVLLEKKATKNNLLNAINKKTYQFIHIATHGLVNYENPRLSALACHQAGTEGDALLFANEIQMQDIQADLVVLSSCESGIGQLIEGEGLIALNRSFIYSGANNVLFSLWKISDKYSSELMIDFYKYYVEGKTYTEALRLAKLKMLTNPATAMPRYWAPFVLIGE